MHCTRCGSPLPPGATSCPNCGQPVPVQAAYAPVPGPTIPNYLVQAILVTLCCCLPFGVVAIVYAAQVNGKLAGGDMNGAMESSRNAKMWCWIALGAGLVAQCIWLMMFGASFLAQLKNVH